MTAVAVRPPALGAPLVLAPRLFVHEGARQALERRLAAALPEPINLAITDNTHAIVTHRSERGVVRARVHHMFLDAPPPIIDALVRYVRHGDPVASAVIGRYIEANHARLARRAPPAARLVTRGAHHDLAAIYQRLNERYFGGQLHALVSWGRRAERPKRARRTIKLGSYSAQERLIRVHPALDRRWVPRYFVEYVVFHEMLHHAMPHTRGAGRSALHPPELRARERELRQHERAAAWEKAHLARLLRA